MHLYHALFAVSLAACGGSATSNDSSTTLDTSRFDDATSSRDTTTSPTDTASRPDTIGTYDGPISDAACSALPASGQWREISPPGSEYTQHYAGIQSIAVRPDDPSVVYVGSSSTGIFKSTDCGTTWAHAATGTNAAMVNIGEPWSIAIDPVMPDVMYSVLGYGPAGLWKSSNAGADWEQVISTDVMHNFANSGMMDSVSIDPGDHTHLVVESHGNCASGHACGAESTDSGATWSLIDMATAGAWQENSGITIVTRTTWLLCGLFGGLFRTTDSGANWTMLNASGALPSCNYYQPYLWQGTDGSYYLPAITYGGPGLLRSAPHDTGTWTIIPNSPQGTVMMPTATHLVMGRNDQPAMQIATQTDPTTWTTLPGPPLGAVPAMNIGGGSSFMAYDPVHHALYVSSFGTGLWQTVIQ